MRPEHKHKIDRWKTFARSALAVWAMASFLAAVVGIAWLAVRLGGRSPFVAAGLAMACATLLNWLVSRFIECRSSKP